MKATSFVSMFKKALLVLTGSRSFRKMLVKSSLGAPD